MKTIYAVWAPAEGDSPEDSTWWYFDSLGDAQDFANDGWGSDYGITNYSETGPFGVEELSVSLKRYRQLTIYKLVSGSWETK